MGIQVLFLALSLASASASDFVYPCFDFNAKKAVELMPAAKLPGTGKEYQENGLQSEEEHGKEKITWAKVRGEVNKPIGRVLALLLDHDTTKSPKVDEMTVKKIGNPLLHELHEVHFVIHPFLFVTVEWTEQWAYAITKGDKTEPEEVLISYQKVEGTSHIKHLCGQVLLKKSGADKTDVYQYEEALATSRKPDDTMQGLLGSLETLRKK